MKPFRVYVAGPVTKGDQLLNVRNAILAGERLRAAGFVPFVPHLFALWHLIVPVDYEEIMAWDLAWLEACDALVRLPGVSPGSDREVAIALERKIPVIMADIDRPYPAIGVDPSDVVGGAIAELREMQKIDVFVCGRRCDHVWDGPELNTPDSPSVTSSVTCSKCGVDAMSASLWEGP